MHLSFAQVALAISAFSPKSMRNSALWISSQALCNVHLEVLMLEQGQSADIVVFPDRGSA
jgi:hypothetical protein